MTGLTWLHLSDWHQTGKDFKRVKLRDALVKDIETRATTISHDLAKIDFVIFSGDAAHSGKPEEYQAVIKEFFDPILKATSLTPDRLIIVPGNHDLDRNHIYEMLPQELQSQIDSHAKVEKWLIDDLRRSRALEPFKSYSEFVKSYTGRASSEYGSAVQLNINEIKVVLLGFNTAWMCARYKELRNGKEEVNDYGHLVLGEPQLYAAFEKAKEADVFIGVLHHPFDWLITTETLPEKSQIREQLSKNCHFILHGHEHEPNVVFPRGTIGDCAIVSAGSSYDRTDPAASRYAHGYNFVHLDFRGNSGVVYLRRYDERQGWIRDTGTTGDEKPGLSEFVLPKSLGQEGKHIPTNSAKPIYIGMHSNIDRERMVLEGYLNALIRNNRPLA